MGECIIGLTQLTVCVTITKLFIRRYKLTTLLSVALQDEYPNTNIPTGFDIVYTGVGKINATYELTKKLMLSDDEMPKQVINFGTAGSVNGKHTGLVEVDIILQRDMIAEPLEPRGITPYQEASGVDHAIVLHSNTNITLGTGDNFVSEDDPWFEYANVDLVDMEAYALAVVCAKMGVKFRCFKYISDSANKEAKNDWESSLKIAKNDFQKLLEEENNLKT